jgi:mannose-6-phosphate isomerase-like protein (cupin superfamily)
MNAEILVRSEQTDGMAGLIDVTVPPRWAGPPLHHHAFHEHFRVLEGELTFELDGERSTAGPGASVFAPGGSIHTLANFTDAPARYLLLVAPGGFERRFDGSGDVPETVVVGPPLAE